MGQRLDGPASRLRRKPTIVSPRTAPGDAHSRGSRCLFLIDETPDVLSARTVAAARKLGAKEQRAMTR